MHRTEGNKDEQIDTLRTRIFHLESQIAEIKEEDSEKLSSCGVPMKIYKRMWSSDLTRLKRRLEWLEEKVRD